MEALERDRSANGEIVLCVAALVARLNPDTQHRLQSGLNQAGGRDELADWIDLLYRLDRAERDALRERLRRVIGPTLRRAAE